MDKKLNYDDIGPEDDIVDGWIKKKTNYLVRYIKPSWSDLHEGEIYECVGEWYNEMGVLDKLAVIDSSGDEYMFSPNIFEVIKPA